MSYTTCNIELEDKIFQQDVLFSFSSLPMCLDSQRIPRSFTIRGKQTKVGLMAEDTSDTKVLRAS